MTNLIETPLQTVKVTIPSEQEKKTKTESTQPPEKVVSMKILTE